MPILTSVCMPILTSVCMPIFTTECMPILTTVCMPILTIVKPKQAGTCGRSIRNEHTSKSLICTNIKYYRTNSIYLLSRLYAILLFITKKTERKWKFGIVDDIIRVLPTSASLFWFYYSV